MSERIGDRLRMLREAHDLTKAEVCGRVRMNRSHLGEIERHKYVPGYWTLLELAKLYGVSLDYLAGLTDAKHNPTVRL